MYSNTHRLVERNYGSVSDFIAAVQRNASSIAQGAAGSGYAALGVWVDDNRQGVFMRILRDNEMALGQSWAWRPHRAFALDRVADDALDWLAQKIRGIV